MSVLLQPGQRQGEDVDIEPGAFGPAAALTDRFTVQVNQQRQKLQELQTLIDNLSSGQETISDKAFEDRLKEAEKAIMELLEEAQTSKGETKSTSACGRNQHQTF